MGHGEWREKWEIPGGKSVLFWFNIVLDPEKNQPPAGGGPQAPKGLFSEPFGHG